MMMPRFIILTRELPYRLISATKQRALTTAPRSSSFNTLGKNRAIRYSSTNHDDNRIVNKPVNFFGSQAAVWRAKDSRSGGADETLWYQPYVISGSLAIFLIYFCVLREENDIDQKLTGSLYEHVSGLEELQLTMNYKYNKENGLDTAEVEKRLVELGIDVKQLEAQLASAQ